MTITNAMLFKLGARLLDIAADKFGNHSCNDFDMSDWSPAERRQLAIDFETYNGDAEELAHLQSLPVGDPEFKYFADWCLMNYVGHKLEELAKGDKP